VLNSDAPSAARHSSIDLEKAKNLVKMAINWPKNNQNKITVVRYSEDHQTLLGMKQAGFVSGVRTSKTSAAFRSTYKGLQLVDVLPTHELTPSVYTKCYQQQLQKIARKRNAVL